jgi:hypothetical protein
MTLRPLKPTEEAVKIKKSIMLVTKTLRGMERELLVYVAVAAALKVRCGLNDAEFDQEIQEARGLDQIEKQLQEKYDPPLQKIHATIDEVDLQKQWARLLEKVGPTGPIN